MTQDADRDPAASLGSLQPFLSSYRIATAWSPSDLEAEVSKLLAEGYFPQGGVAVAGVYQQWEDERKGYTESETLWHFSQAMAKI